MHHDRRLSIPLIGRALIALVVLPSCQSEPPRSQTSPKITLPWTDIVDRDGCRISQLTVEPSAQAWRPCGSNCEELGSNVEKGLVISGHRVTGSGEGHEPTFVTTSTQDHQGNTTRYWTVHRGDRAVRAWRSQTRAHRLDCRVGARGMTGDRIAYELVTPGQGMGTRELRVCECPPGRRCMRDVHIAALAPVLRDTEYLESVMLAGEAVVIRVEPSGSLIAFPVASHPGDVAPTLLAETSQAAAADGSVVAWFEPSAASPTACVKVWSPSAGVGEVRCVPSATRAFGLSAGGGQLAWIEATPEERGGGHLLAVSRLDNPASPTFTRLPRELLPGILGCGRYVSRSIDGGMLMVRPGGDVTRYPLPRDLRWTMDTPVWVTCDDVGIATRSASGVAVARFGLEGVRWAPLDVH